jgi:hypothetical protein
VRTIIFVSQHFPGAAPCNDAPQTRDRNKLGVCDDPAVYRHSAALMRVNALMVLHRIRETVCFVYHSTQRRRPCADFFMLMNRKSICSLLQIRRQLPIDSNRRMKMSNFLDRNYF